MTIPCKHSARRGTEERFVKAIKPRLKRYGRDRGIYCQGPDVRPGKAPDWVIYLKARAQAQTAAGILRVTGLGSGEEILVELERTEEADLERLEALWTWLEGELDALGFAEVGEGAPASEDPLETGEEPWNQIPDHRWHRDAVRWWCQGLEGQQIANQIEQITSGKTVLNRISKLRTEYPEAGIPYNEDR